MGARSARPGSSAGSWCARGHQVPSVEVNRLACGAEGRGAQLVPGEVDEQIGEVGGEVVAAAVGVCGDDVADDNDVPVTDPHGAHRQCPGAVAGDVLVVQAEGSPRGLRVARWVRCRRRCGHGRRW